MRKPSGTNVVRFRLTATAAQQRIRELSVRSQNLVWTKHIQERMEERGIDADAVLRILREGHVEDPPEEQKSAGDWKAKVVRKMNTGRVAGVVTIIVQNSRLVLKTAEWEDRR